MLRLLLPAMLLLALVPPAPPAAAAWDEPAPCPQTCDHQCDNTGPVYCMCTVYRVDGLSDLGSQCLFKCPPASMQLWVVMHGYGGYHQERVFGDIRCNEVLGGLYPCGPSDDSCVAGHKVPGEDLQAACNLYTGVWAICWTQDTDPCVPPACGGGEGIEGLRG